MMINPSEIVVINARFMFNTEADDYIFDEVVATLSASYSIQRVCPANCAAYVVHFSIRDSKIGAIIFIAPGQRIEQACADYVDTMIDISKAPITLGPYAMN